VLPQTFSVRLSHCLAADLKYFSFPSEKEIGPGKEGGGREEGEEDKTDVKAVSADLGPI